MYFLDFQNEMERLQATFLAATGHWDAIPIPRESGTLAQTHIVLPTLIPTTNPTSITTTPTFK